MLPSVQDSPVHLSGISLKEVGSVASAVQKFEGLRKDYQNETSLNITAIILVHLWKNYNNINVSPLEYNSTIRILLSLNTRVIFNLPKLERTFLS